ncbi:MAG: BamA/TamA family outer membrane protein [Proteobacteria bacterium]|nr:BamA/TamA family outer membrane protein [Pseudomonadota bacterium]
MAPAAATLTWWLSALALAAPRPGELSFIGQLADRQELLAEVIGGLLNGVAADRSERLRLLQQAAPCAALAEDNATAATLAGRATHAALARLTSVVDEHLGYCVVQVRAAGERIVVELRRRQTLRRIRLRGNWPLFEQELLRRLGFRPGQALPEGPALAAAMARQKARLTGFLARRGYFDGRVDLTLSRPDEQQRVDLDVRLHKGRTYRVGSVEVLPLGPVPKGQRWKAAIPQNEIARLFRGQVLLWRRAFNTERLERNVQELTLRYQRRGYTGARVQASYTIDRHQPPSRAIKITLKIQERKRVQIEYLGNQHLRRAELDRVLTLRSSGAYDDFELATSAEALHRLYQSQGYLRARVRFTRALHRTHDKIIFRIDEGPQCRVRAVAFVGNRSFSSATLARVIRTRPYPWLGLGAGGFVTTAQLEQDAQRLVRHYRSHGYLQARVTGDLAPHAALLGHAGALAAALAADAPALRNGQTHVRFTIDEGAPLRFGSIALGGVRSLTPATLRADLPIAQDQPFAADRITAAKELLVRRYAEAGHPYATVRSREAPDPARGRVDVLLSVDEGPLVRFGPVLLRGNNHTRSVVIRRLVALQPGAPFDIRRLELTEQNLRQIGAFNAVRTRVVGLPARLRVVPVVLQVEERHDDYGAVELGVGASTDNAFFGTIGYDWQNLLGLGANLNAIGELGPRIQSGTLNLSYPRALGSLFGTELALFMRNERTRRLGDITTFGGTATLQRPLRPGLTSYLRYELRQVLSEERLYRPATPFDEADQARVTTRTGALSAALLYDRRDNPLAPTRGHFSALTLSWASRALAGTDNFLKLRLHAHGFLPLFAGLTLAAGARYDHGLPLGNAKVLPRVERFFAGGDTTIRGYEEDLAFAESIGGPLYPLPGVELVTLTPQGGNVRLLTNVELQFPIWRESPLLGLPLMGALFLDSGVIRNAFEHWRWSATRQGAGGAVRIVTLVGFLSLEYAFALRPRLGDSRDGRFHFNFGYVF